MIITRRFHVESIDLLNTLRNHPAKPSSPQGLVQGLAQDPFEEFINGGDWKAEGQLVKVLTGILLHIKNCALRVGRDYQGMGVPVTAQAETMRVCLARLEDKRLEYMFGGEGALDGAWV